MSGEPLVVPAPEARSMSVSFSFVFSVFLLLSTLISSRTISAKKVLRPVFRSDGQCVHSDPLLKGDQSSTHERPIRSFRKNSIDENDQIQIYRKEMKRNNIRKTLKT